MILLQMSTGSGMGPGDDSSNDGLVIVDDAHTTFPPCMYFDQIHQNNYIRLCCSSQGCLLQ